MQMVDFFAVIAVTAGCMLFAALCCYLIFDNDDMQDDK